MKMVQLDDNENTSITSLVDLELEPEVNYNDLNFKLYINIDN